MQTVLVLGATGFIGRRIVQQLSASGWANVVAASRRSAAYGTDPRVRPLALDATRESDLRGALVGVDAVVNCVAGDAHTIVRSAEALFAAARGAASQPRVVHFSSLAAYGSLDGEVHETAVPRGDLGDYSAAKLATEKLAAPLGTVVTLRPGIVYGPGSEWWSDRIGQLLCARRLGDLGRLGVGLCNLVFVDDVAAAALLALRTPGIAGRAFNLGSPRVPTWNEYFARYAQALGAAPVRRISAQRIAVELYCVAPALKLLELAGRSPPPPIRPWLMKLCAHRIALAVRRAEEALGMRWTSLESGLSVTAAWYHARGSR